MDLYELSFGKIILLSDDLAEVIVDDGISMDTRMVDEYHQFLLEHLKAPFSLLVNKINSYTYDFEAQQKLANLDQINKMAVVSYNRITTAATEYLKELPVHQNWNLEIFTDRDTALAWLKPEDSI